MTASDHPPYYVPDYFKSHYTSINDQITEYADWSLRQFISMASKQSWFKNTLFVFIADHGEAINTTYDISLDYHHTPLILYAPDILPCNKTFDMIGGQIDVFPTIMGAINLPFINATLGIDLLKQTRPYIFINSDDKYGVLNKELFLIVRKDGSSNLYKYLNYDKTDYLKTYENEANQMNDYARSNLQVFQYILKKGAKYI
jgi:phosphoglycerol transferase MdoB-like AlkP superfamily enzyme